MAALYVRVFLCPREGKGSSMMVYIQKSRKMTRLTISIEKKRSSIIGWSVELNTSSKKTRKGRTDQIYIII